MKQLRNCSVGGTGLALLVSLGMGSWAYAQCTNDVGAGDYDEGEACAQDDYDDAINGGCNSTPPVFSDLGTADFTFGQVIICGVASTFDYGDPPTDRRDTDWYRISQQTLADHDRDGNGVVQILSEYLGSETDVVTFIMGLEDVAGECNTTLLSGYGCWDVDTPANSVGAKATVVIADWPEGIVAFAATGICTGDGVFDGVECALGLNDYLLKVTLGDTWIACAPGGDPPRGPCNEPNPGVPGCEDPDCCKLVCEEFDPQCCINEWTQQCAEAAVDLDCAPAPGNPVFIATGPTDVDGYLRVKSDPFGAWADEAAGGTTDGSDYFNPAGPEPGMAAGYTSAFFFFKADTQQRELLANNLYWQTLPGYDYYLDESLEREILLVNVPSDTNGDGVDDTLVSIFRVFGVGVDVTFDVTQHVEVFTAGEVSTLTQTYVMTNNNADAIDFVLMRAYDHDMLWVTNDFGDDTVGTGTNGSPAPRYVYCQEAGFPETGITISSTSGDAYVGGKQTVNPDPNDPECVPYDYGTDTEEWEVYGVPTCWRNNIANVGYSLNGNSGASPGTDAHITLEVPVSLTALGTDTIEIVHTFGQTEPAGEPSTCPEDCDGSNDGLVDILDFLEVLAQWGEIGGTCDMGLGDPGVGINEFLAVLGQWGSCP
jgi:hypothetical protein